MPDSREKRPGRSPHKQNLNHETAEQSKTRIRIGRACDRCKLKKSKCDGNIPCSGCISSDSVCEYSARRRREVREWYWEMHEIIDEALQSLYWACREGRGFPGTVPDENNGHVSTDAILRGLGFLPPAVERVNGAGPAVNPFLDDADGTPERSYYPPDLPSNRRSFNSSVLGQMRPAGGAGHHTFEDGLGQQEGQRDGQQVRQIALIHDPVFDGLDPRFRVAMDGGIDGNMFHGGPARGMDIDLTRSSEMGIPNFQPPIPTDGAHSYRSVECGDKDPEPSVGQIHGPLNSEDGRWDSQLAPKSGEMLPWPGTLAALSRNRKLDGRGFNPPSSL